MIGMNLRFYDSDINRLILTELNRLRPYQRENTGSRLITEVKPFRASLVLGWVTA